ncbi:biotin--[acetyl-CoA-carboxylase] ligase [Prochlorococcus sp. MIT 1307]|uniref:biotin--[acetyl-CoA-carboxylase] ligase n=1 Tax=Prochlorococcus sp. MIT 1307 TaxID=3096219 RepID=UPI002A758D0C|nr:biotin--[acetyl-CoA-carboxylase] ligase [Prochlorococcus sp. MIT 1307]
MRTANSFTGGAAVAQFLRSQYLGKKVWQLRWKPVCASTEFDLSDWLKEKPFKGQIPRALIAARQTHGMGQRGRIWKAPAGGVWISAAFPLIGDQKSAGLLGLAVAVAMVHRLEKYCVSAQIKWPNDLLVGDRKLAGLLPRLVYRGDRLRLGRIGLGLNVCNHVPDGGISLVELLRPINCQPFLWAAEVLFALDCAMEMIEDAEAVRYEAENLLWAQEVKDPETEMVWEIDGLDINGALRLRKGSYKTVWNRWA